VPPLAITYDLMSNRSLQRIANNSFLAVNSPRYQAEYCIQQGIRELDYYARVFTDRIVRAFESLDEEADRLRDEACQRACRSCNAESDDEAHICEWADSLAGDFYCSVSAIKQGVLNLMVAALYHFFEQHADRLLDNSGLPRLPKPPTDQYSAERLVKYLLALGVDVSKFGTWDSLDELRLVANTVKHGNGASAENLRARKPTLFAACYPSGQRQAPFSMPVMPLAGQGLYLSADDFERYRSALFGFWSELADALLPICGLRE